MGDEAYRRMHELISAVILFDCTQPFQGLSTDACSQLLQSAPRSRGADSIVRYSRVKRALLRTFHMLQLQNSIRIDPMKKRGMPGMMKYGPPMVPA